MSSQIHIHGVSVCVSENFNPGYEFEVMLDLHIMYRQNQTGRLVFEMALKFVVQDPTDSNVGNAQGATESKLLKIFVFSVPGR